MSTPSKIKIKNNPNYISNDELVYNEVAKATNWLLDNSGDSMTYPAAGIPVSTGVAWGASIADNSADWDTAFGWGNHASAGYQDELVSATNIKTINGSSILGAGDLVVGGSNVWTLISTANAVGVSVIDFTGLNNTYSMYKIICDGLTANNQEFYARVGTGVGPTWQTSGYQGVIAANFTIGQGFGANSGTQFKIGVANNSGINSSHFELTIVNPSQSSLTHHLYGHCVVHSSTNYWEYFVGGHWESATPVTAIRILTVGTFGAGTFKLYGIT